MARKFGKKNHVKVDPFNYSLMLLGEPKIGKTTLLYEVAEKEVGSDGYIFAEFFREKGAGSIEGIMAENIPDWDYWIEFVDDIVDNKDTDYSDLRVVFVDTYDQYISLAEQEALRLWNRKNPDKRADSLKQTWGGFNGPSDKVKELMFEQTDRLNEVGVQVWWIGHCKLKDVKDVYSDETYQVLTSDQMQTYFNSLKKNLHFLCLAYFDRQLQKEKTGRKNIVNNKDEIKTVIKDETRKVKFRDDGFVVDSGSRFGNIKSEVNLDADEFINAIKDAIRFEIEKNGGSVEKRAKENADEAKADAERVATEIEAKKTKKELDEIVSQIVNFFVTNKSDVAKVTPVLTAIKNAGYANPKEISSIKDAQAILALTLQ